MKKRNARVTKEPGEGDIPDPLEQRYFYQALPPDIQMVVLQGVKFRLSREGLPHDLGLLDLDDLLDQETDDLINRHSMKRTIPEWLAFAQRGE